MTEAVDSSAFPAIEDELEPRGWGLQHSQVPERLPELPGVALAARYVPATSAPGAGGDWFDVIPLDDGRVGLAIGDVAGRGRDAAATMAALRNALRAYALEDEGAAATMAKLERFADSLEPGRPATVLYAVVDRDAAALRFVSAGHPAPLLVPAEGEPVFAAPPPAAPVGAGAHPVRDEVQAEMAAGTTLLLYSNGLVLHRGERPCEAREHLRATVAGGRREPESLVTRLAGSVLDGPAPADDLVLLAVQVAQRAEPELHLTVPALPEELSAVRWTLRRWLAGRGASDREVGQITLACQEACANAVEHAYGLPDATFELTARHLHDVLEIVIRDRGRWRPPRGEHRGRGLAIMRSLMDEVDVIAGDAGTAVRLAQRLGTAA